MPFVFFFFFGVSYYHLINIYILIKYIPLFRILFHKLIFFCQTSFCTLSLSAFYDSFIRLIPLFKESAMIKKHKNLIIALLPVILVPLGYFIAQVYSKIRIFVLPCPFNTFWHIYCPGCGGTRAVYALLDFDFLRAVRCNALYCAFFLLCALFWLENLMALMGKNVKIIPRSRVFIVTASGIALAYLILRNFIPLLAPV